jgi:glycolate oxidase iron-sulfur subunit
MTNPSRPEENPKIAAEKLKELQRALAYEDTFNCIQCGYCLPVCPTYETMGTETHSPRGRINLVKLTAEGKLTNWTLLADSIDNCLGCRACETACPTGVKYGHIFESAKEAIAERTQYSAPIKTGRNVLFRGLFPNKRLMNSLAGSLWVYQMTGLESVVNKLKLTRVLPKSIAAFAGLLPRQTSPFKRLRRPSAFHPAQGKPRYRVAFFTGCIMDALFERINRLSMELLAAGGCEVVAIPGETCCGALHAHSGERSTSKDLAKRNIAAFERLAASGAVDFVVNNAGGCGAMLSEYTHLLSDEPEWQERASRFTAVSKDISEVLALLELPFQRSEEQAETVTYQRSCHMTNVQKVTAQPVQLIRSIPGIRLEEMIDKEKCCGSAGIYNVVHYDESMDILDLKMKAVHGTAARTIVTTNPGCLLQMQLGIQREGLGDGMRAVHLVELLAEACGLE